VLEQITDLPTIDEHHGASRPGKLFSAPSTPSNKAHLSHHGSTHSSAADLSHHLAHFGMFDASAGGVHHHHSEGVVSTASGDGPPSPTDKASRRLSHASLSTASQSHSRDFISSVQQISPSKAEKKIVEMATEIAPDLQVSVLIEIDFSNRKINLGEKEMLMKGLRLEGDGDLDAAVSCYARAGMHSKDPHISKLLVGNLYYKNDKLMLALNFYTQAAQILANRSSSNRLVLDEFITYRNRGIINFRLGDDQGGLHDLKRAVELMPQDIELRELVSLAKRRMGRYAQAIQEATVAKTIRNERKRQELLLEKQRDIARKKKFLQAEKERNRQKIAGAVVYNASAKFTQFASRSSRHASVMSRPATAPSDASLGSDADLQGTSGKQTLFQDSSTAKDEDINARLLQTRGYVLHIDEPRCLNSLRDRVAESRKHVKASVENDQQSSEETFLRVFKMNNGYKADLFQDIFERPSELQEALLVHPEHRTTTHLETISTSLKLIPLLSRLSDSVLTDLAKAIEYRALTTKDTIFSQGDQSCAVCFLLSGHVQVKMEKQSAGSSTIDINIGDVSEYTTFGHIDFLFRNNNARIMQEVEKVIRPRRSRRAKATAATGSMVLQSSSTVGHGYGKGIAMPHTPHTPHISHTLHATHTPHTPHLPHAPAIDEGDEGEDCDSTVDQEVTAPMLTFAGRGGAVDRSLAPGMFKTYAIQSMCELLILRENEYEKLLLQPALDDLKRRLDAIRSCGIFNNWTPAQHVRLARMGIIKRVRKGDTILTQGHRPNFLYIILKGICIVQKQPNRTEMLVQKLTTAREKADAFDSRYIFDHRLVDTLRLANLKEEFKPANADNPEVAFTLADAKRNPDSILRSHHVTASELERYKLQLEINKLEGLIQSAAQEDAREEDIAMTVSSSRKHNSTGNNPAASAGAGTGGSNGAPVLELKVADIAAIQWPKIFGEACIVDPENGRSRGSVVADTACEIFMLHKAQIQTFPVDDTFLSSVKGQYWVA
jgi:CRP-like cAMP-binding protein